VGEAEAVEAVEGASEEAEGASCVSPLYICMCGEESRAASRSAAIASRSRSSQLFDGRGEM